MADAPRNDLAFTPGCPDCGTRAVQLPATLPNIGDDFDWHVRDYDSIRLFMLEELIARFPDRKRWTPADMEVVLVEVMAAVLDQLSDMLDRVSGEAWLESARRPESVRRLLEMIGYDAIRMEGFTYNEADIDSRRKAAAALHALWEREPHRMELARVAGPRAIHTQHRMVTTEDCAQRLEDHPLVLRAHAWSRWTGSWTTIFIAIIGWRNLLLDQTLPVPADPTDPLMETITRLQAAVTEFHLQRSLPLPAWDQHPTLRKILRDYLDRYRMVGQEVLMQDAVPVGIQMVISLRLAPEHFQSEIRSHVAQALGMGPGGFFAPGRLQFGEDLHAGDIFQTLLELDGVETVCLNRFKRVGSAWPDQSESGLIPLLGVEIAVCDNNPAAPERGQYTLKLHGGIKG